MELDWGSILEKAGIGGVAVASLWIIWKIVLAILEHTKSNQERMLEQWANSTDALNKNTTAFNNLSETFRTAHEREVAFQKELVEMMHDVDHTTKDTNRRVREIHRLLNAADD